MLLEYCLPRCRKHDDDHANDQFLLQVLSKH